MHDCLLTASKPLHNLRPRPHYTVFKRKQYCFVPNTATVHTSLQCWKRSPKTDRFENALQSGTIWKRYCLKTLFPSVDGENDAIWKRWRHYNNTTWVQTTQPWVSKIADRRFLVDSLLIAVIFSPLTLLKEHLTVLKLPLWFFKKRTRYCKAS